MTSSQDLKENGYVVLPWDLNDPTAILFPDEDGKDKLYRRWDLIKCRLKNHIPNVDCLVEVIRSYNVYYDENNQPITPAWSFKALRDFVLCMELDEKDKFFSKNGILYGIQQLVLNGPEVCSKIKWLVSGRQDSISVHQMQVAVLLANAFFCTYPKRGKNQPSINFSSLFEGGNRNGRKPTHVEKLKCIVHYFKRIQKKQPIGVLEYRRCVTPEDQYPRWGSCSDKLGSMLVDSEGRIEDQPNTLQVDFANRVVGGGVLGWGCVQEEIRFIICPELIVARLFTEPLADNEALLVIGAERYCNYSGYSDAFQFAGDHVDITPRDPATSKLCSQILAVDACKFNKRDDQYREGRILREIKKIYTGILPWYDEVTIPLATGNWGCGVYRGDPQLKSLLQLIAASRAKRQLNYFTFGDEQLKTQLQLVYQKLVQLNITAGQLYRILVRYIKDRHKNQTVFQFVHSYSSDYKSLYNNDIKSGGFRNTSSTTRNETTIFKCGTGPQASSSSSDVSALAPMDVDTVDTPPSNSPLLAYKLTKKDPRESNPWPKFYIEDNKMKRTIPTSAESSRASKEPSPSRPANRPVSPSLFSDNEEFDMDPSILRLYQTPYQATVNNVAKNGTPQQDMTAVDQQNEEVAGAFSISSSEDFLSEIPDSQPISTSLLSSEKKRQTQTKISSYFVKK